MCLYRPVDQHGIAVDFLLSAKRDQAAATWFLCKVIGRLAVTDEPLLFFPVVRRGMISQIGQILPNHPIRSLQDIKGWLQEDSGSENMRQETNSCRGLSQCSEE